MVDQDCLPWEKISISDLEDYEEFGLGHHNLLSGHNVGSDLHGRFITEPKARKAYEGIKTLIRLGNKLTVITENRYEWSKDYKDLHEAVEKFKEVIDS